MSDRFLPQKEPFSGDTAYKMSIRAQDFRISKRLETAIDKIYHGFYSLKEACEEAYKICKEDGIQEDRIGDIIRVVLKRKGLSERSVLRYLPKELKDRSKIHSLPSPPTKLSANEGNKDEEESSSAYYYKSLYGAEKQKRENLEAQFIEASFKTADEILGDPTEEKLRQIQEGHEKALRELEEEKNLQIQEATIERDTWKRRYEDSQNNLGESQEFKNATRQIEIAYEDQITHWRSECQKANEKYRDINRIPKIVEFTPSRLKCLDLIFENQDGILYLEHDGLKVIKVTPVRPIEQGGEIVS